jgi:hypothetical protein
MVEDDSLNTPIGGKPQYYLRTLLVAIMGVAVFCAGVYYLGPINVVVWILHLGPPCVVVFAVTMIIPAVAAHFIARRFGDQNAGLLLVSVPAMVGLGCVLLEPPMSPYRGLAEEALINCFIWPRSPLILMALLFFLLVIFPENSKSLITGLFRRRLPYNVLLTWAIICAFVFLVRCSGISHAWWFRPFAAKLEFAGTNLLLYLAGAIPLALASRPWRFVTDVGPMGKAVVTLAAISWGYLLAALLYAILLHELGWIE